MALTPCPSCSRHVRVAETVCPFCKTTIDASESTPRAMPTQRLGRAATFAFGAAIAVAAPGCATSTTPQNDAYAGGVDTGGLPVDAGTDSALVAAYGGPPVDSNFPDSGTSALYGAPPPPPEPER